MLRGIQVTWSEMRREYPTINRNAENVSDSWIKNEDFVEMKSEHVSLVDFHGFPLSKTHHGPGSVVNQAFIDEWIGVFASYASQNEIPYIINLNGFAYHSLRYGAFKMPRWFWETYGVSEPRWTDGMSNSQKNAQMEKQADIVISFWNKSDPKMESCRQAWIEAWEALALKFKDDPYCIGLALSNEPLHHTFKWQNGDPAIAEGYRDLCTEAIDAIRAKGFSKLILVDRPYLGDANGKIDNDLILPIDRENIGWEAHQYHSTNTTLPQWKAKITEHVNRFGTNGFGKLVLILEFGHHPKAIYLNLPPGGLESETIEMKEHMESLEPLGLWAYAFHSHSRMDGKYGDVQSEWFTESETAMLYRVLYPDEPTPPIEPPKPPTSTDHVYITIPLADGSKVKVKINAEITIET